MILATNWEAIAALAAAITAVLGAGAAIAGTFERLVKRWRGIRRGAADANGGDVASDPMQPSGTGSAPRATSQQQDQPVRGPSARSEMTVDGDGQMWSRGGELIARLQHGEGEGFISTAQFSVDGQHLVTASVGITLDSRPSRGSLRVWRVGPWTELRRFPGAPVWDAAISGDSRLLLYTTVGGPLHSVELDWSGAGDDESEAELGSGMLALSLDGKIAAVDFPEVDAEGDVVGVGGIDAYDVASGEVIFHVDYFANGLALSPDGRLIASWHDNEVTLWQVREQVAVRQLVHDSRITDVVVPSGSIVATGSEDGTSRLWDIGTGKQTLLVRCVAPVAGVAVCEAAGLLAASCGSDVHIFDAETGRPLSRLDCGDEVSALDLTADGAMLAAGTSEVLVWRAA